MCVVGHPSSSSSVRAVGGWATGGCVVVNVITGDDGINFINDAESDGGRDRVDAIRGHGAVLDLGGS